MNKVVRLVGILIGAVVLAIVLCGSYFYVASNRIVKHVYSVTVPPVTVPTDSASLERGRHLATAITKCVDCHGDDLGGQVMIPDPKFAIVAAPNITRAPSGLGGQLSDQDIARAVRFGLKPDGTPLLLMASDDFWYLSDTDLGEIIAWVRSMPPVNHDVPPTKVGPIARVLFTAHKLPLIPAEHIDFSATRPPVPPEGPTAEYGHYLMRVGGCYGCHGPSLSGGPIPGAPPDWKPAANITPTTTGTWTEADFMRVLRDGRTPLGITLDTLMPYRYTKLMTDQEIHAVWSFLQTVPKKEFGEQ